MTTESSKNGAITLSRMRFSRNEGLLLEFVIPGLFSQSRDPGLRNFQSRDWK